MSDAEFSERVRAADPDRHLSVLYAPADKRAALFTLYAFDLEIASIRDRVREALPGEIRLQWWRDTLAAGMPVGNPLADALNDAIRHFDLPLSAFDNTCEARIFDLYDDPMPSRTDLEGYLGETEGTVIQLAALILDRDAAIAHAGLAGHAGCARGIAKLLRRLPVWRARGQCFIPRDILAAAGTTPEAFAAADAGQGARTAIEAMTALAREHLAAFEREAPKLPASLRPAYLPLAAASKQLAALADAGKVLAGSAGAIAPWTRHRMTLWRALRGWTG